ARSRAAYAWRNMAIVRRNILSAMKLWRLLMIDLNEAGSRNNAARSAAQISQCEPLMDRAPLLHEPGHERDGLQQDLVSAAHGFSDARRAATARAGTARALARSRYLRTFARSRPQPRQVRAARRTAIRQRQHPHGHRARGHAQGCGEPQPSDAGVRVQP